MSETDILEGRAVYAASNGKVEAQWIETQQAAGDRIRIIMGYSRADLTIAGARRLARHLNTIAKRAEDRAALAKAGDL